MLLRYCWVMTMATAICGRHYFYSFIPLPFFDCPSRRNDCRSLSDCSQNNWLMGIRFAVRISRLSLSRKICKGVLSVANHRLCSVENSRPIKFLFYAKLRASVSKYNFWHARSYFLLPTLLRASIFLMVGSVSGGQCCFFFSLCFCFIEEANVGFICTEFFWNEIAVKGFSAFV